MKINNLLKNKRNPTVSVIIPTYNRAHLLPKSIQSILDQVYQDFEIIIVDDASTDNTEEIVKKFQKKDERIRYIKHEKNKRASAARNTGIKLAKGKFIAFQDSDDEWLPEKLEKQMQVFENASAGVGVVYTGFWRIEGDKKTYIPSSWVKQKEGDIHNELLRENFVGTPTSVVKKECFEKAGMFDEELAMLEDWELWIRISQYYKFAFIDEPLLLSYYTPHSVNKQGGATRIKTLKLILEKHFEDIKKDKKILSKHYFGIGVSLCSNGNFRNGRRYLIKTVKAYPLNIKFLLAAFLSLFGQNTYNTAKKIYRKIKVCIPKFSNNWRGNY